MLERTAELERRNELLSEYAFINSNLLRGPICTMRGLVNLVSMDEISSEERVLLLDKLNLPIDRLNEFCDNITNALHNGYFISREEIR